MTKLKGILLTQGMHGMISQVEGLAKALDLDFTHHTVELNNFWKLFPPKITPISQKVFKKIEVKDFDVIISCGRKSVVPSIYLKKISSKKVINIHIQNPKVNLDNFSYVIAPEHDQLTGDNVLSTKGAMHYLTKEEIKMHTNYLKDKLQNGKEYFLLILGGPTKHYDYSNENILNILNLFNDLIKKNNLQGIVIPSMRTPKNIIELCNQINFLNYGLTIGIHSRIDKVINTVIKNTSVGNTYINRNIVGAVVGSQPFGGHNKSGTGPKAGGPEYLKKFCYEYSISNNVVAMGGNVDLLSSVSD